MKKRLLNTLLCLCLLVALLPTAALAVDDAHVHEANNPDSNCIVCQVAGMINALPDAEDITVDNAAAVIDQIHAIDRVKVQLTDDEYEELLLLVNQGNNGSGGGLGVPVDYMDAVKKIREFGGNSLYISKSFAGYDSSDISDIEVEFTITGDNGFSQALTMSTMDYIPNSLSADSDFYSTDADGWTYKYILPAGTYTITETQNAGATRTAYTVNGAETDGSATFTIENGEDYSVSVLNWGSTLTISLIDENGNSITDFSGFEFKDSSGNPKQDEVYNDETYTIKGFFDGDVITVSSIDGSYITREITLSVDEVNEICSGSGTGVTDNGTDSIAVAMEKPSVKVSVVDKANTSNKLTGARIQIIDDLDTVVDEWDSTTGSYEVKGLIIGTTYKLYNAVAPDGYIYADDITFTIDEYGQITSSGSVEADGTMLMELSATEVKVKAWGFDNTDPSAEAVLPGATLQIWDSSDNKVREWTSSSTPETITGLLVGETYMLKIATAPTDYYIDSTDITFSIDEFGDITTDTEVDVNDYSLLMKLGKIAQYYIPLKNAELKYGEPWVGSVIDSANATLNGEPWWDPMIGSGIYLVWKDSSGNETDSRMGRTPVGEYTVTCHPIYQDPKGEITYDFGSPVTVTVVPKTLALSDFTVTANDKVYDGTKAVTFGNATVSGILPGDSLVVGTDVILTGEFEDAAVGTGKTVNYTIELANTVKNYALSDGTSAVTALIGTTQADITAYVPAPQPPIYIPPVHSCTSQCPDCGGCRDLDCDERVCADKCYGEGKDFSDVEEDDWFYDSVKDVTHSGLMEGIGGGLFDPFGDTSRAMIVTVLWRMEGAPVVNYAMTFEDVAEGLWYTEAIRWAASENIVEGYSDTTFGSTDTITREQFATILWRYAKYKGYDVSVGEDTNILSYEDAFSISEWAIPAMQWACGSGLIQGDGVNLTPGAEATRAQAAALFQRFCENVAKK